VVVSGRILIRRSTTWRQLLVFKYSNQVKLYLRAWYKTIKNDRWLCWIF